MISSVWAPMFAPLPGDVRRALTNALRSAWMDKNLQYPVAQYLPVQGGLHHSYTPSLGHGHQRRKCLGGSSKVREAAAGPTLVERLQLWGVAYIDRAARLQYH